jgi:hypothetical protein
LIHTKRFLAFDWLDLVGDAVACADVSSVIKLVERLLEVRLEGYQEFYHAKNIMRAAFIDPSITSAWRRTLGSQRRILLQKSRIWHLVVRADGG